MPLQLNGKPFRNENIPDDNPDIFHIKHYITNSCKRAIKNLPNDNLIRLVAGIDFLGTGNSRVFDTNSKFFRKRNHDYCVNVRFFAFAQGPDLRCQPYSRF